MRTKNQFRRLWAFVSFFVLSVAMAVAATMATVEGQVVDQTGEPIIGASVLVKGTTNGTITDFDGNFVIQNVDNNATLIVSYVGYITQEVKVTRGKMKIVLKEDSKTLEELVVTGYATQAKKDITGSVAVVSRDALTEVPVATFAEALQGKASGVTINNSGGPAGQTTIRVRGVGSVNGSDPLIIVDGVQGIDINSVNPNDIESLQVLKDAAATAIYGARAANGVIIVTTKQGNKESKVRVNYSGYISASTMANDGFHMLGAWDHMQALKTANENSMKYRGAQDNGQHGEMPYLINPGFSLNDAVSYANEHGGSVSAGDRRSLLDWYTKNSGTGANAYALSSYYYILDVLGGTEEEARRGTDWFDVATQTGITHNHELSLQGGTDKGMYAVSLGYTSREGTLKGSSFERYNMRMNSTYNPTKHFTVGLNSTMALMNFTGERGSMADTSVFGQTYTAGSLVPMYNLSGTFAGSRGGYARDNTALASVLNAEGDWNRNFRMNTAFFAEIKDPWVKGLTLRSQFAVSLNGGWSRNFSERSEDWNKEGTTTNTLSESANWSFNWQWTNTVQYKTRLADHHDITAMLGMEALKNGLGHNLSGSRSDYDFPNAEITWTLNNGSVKSTSLSGSRNGIYTMFGYFGRVDYSYDGKYLVTATLRRDASSRFGAANRWGTFPSVSLGWRMSDEAFLAKAHETWLDDLKLRAGYGTTGNSNIANYNFAYQYGTSPSYSYALDGSNMTAGYVQTAMGENTTKWETVKMANVGVDLTALNNKLTANVDFYVKTTSDMLLRAAYTSMAGSATKPSVNIGSMKNTGIDITLGWRDKIGKVGYNISATASWYKNEVTELGGADLFDGDNRVGEQSQRTTVGQPIGMFFGYVVDGIYQSPEDVVKYGVVPMGAADLQSASATSVGNYKYKDVNGDGKINSDDRTFIGNPHPDLTGGINISLTYKNWDLGAYMYYTLGNDLIKAFEAHTLWGMLGNAYSYDRLNRAWSNENPTGDLPLFVGTEAGTNTQFNSNYVEDGSYLRMQTLTLGYTLPKAITKKLTMNKIRLYAQLGNVFTLTKYSGLDPEVASFGNDRRMGTDYGNYGVPHQYLFGVNVDF
ncbi:MAG: TonB-dependent receptor [Bacteroidaceae bacterium]|nr:TonB-dependent receptor [Bacteroidaceae bacterium]